MAVQFLRVSPDAARAVRRTLEHARPPVGG
jgi:hypothetical protein